MRAQRAFLAAVIVGAVLFGGALATRAQLDAYVQRLLIRSNPDIDEAMIRRLHALDICIGRTVSQSTECKAFRALRNTQWGGLVVALVGAGAYVAASSRRRGLSPRIRS